MANRITTKETQSDGARWLKRLAEAISDKEEKPERGFYTIEQLSKLLGKSETTMRAFVRNNPDQVEQRSYKVKCGSRILPTAHYRLKS